MRIGENIKELRQKAGLTQAEFAKKIGVPVRTLQNWEINHREPKLAALMELATSLGVTVDALISDKPSNSRARSAKK